jgi:hypothetical protein
MLPLRIEEELLPVWGDRRAEMIGDGLVQAKSRHDAEKRGEIDPKLLLGLFNSDEVHCLFHMQAAIRADAVRTGRGGAPY